MRYYQFNIADYRKDTAHLSIVEHYIYRQLIDWYYLDEKPIPKETQTVMRRLSLDSSDASLLKNVLDDFFIERASGWNHSRVDEDILAYKHKAAQNKENGKKGGRPKKQSVSSDDKPKKTQPVTGANPRKSEINPNQELLTKEPLTREPSKETNPLPESDDSDGFDDFWNSYPKKADKKKARAKWRRMPKKDRELATKDAPVRFAGKDKQFIPMPTTYLNGERWHDEVEQQESHHQYSRTTRDNIDTLMEWTPPGDGSNE